MIPKAYIVVQGDSGYEDYSIVRVFANEEKAKEYSEWYPDTRVESYPLGDMIDFDEAKMYVCYTTVRWNLLSPSEQIISYSYHADKHISDARPVNSNHYNEINGTCILIIARTVPFVGYDEKECQIEFKNDIDELRKRVESLKHRGMSVIDINKNICFV